MTEKKVGLFQGIKNVICSLLGLLHPVIAFLVFEILVLFLNWNGWVSVASVILAILLYIVISASLQIDASRNSTEELSSFLVGNSFTSYQSVDFWAYFESLGDDHFQRIPLKHNPSPPNATDSILYRRLMEKKFDVLAFYIDPASASNEDPMEIKSFPSTIGMYIFLPFKPEEMHGIENFKFLHEAGHLSARAFHRNIGITIFTVVAFIGIFLIASRIQLSPTSIAIICSLAVLTFYLQKLAKDNKVVDTVDDEITADYFALTRSDLAWFKDFSSEKLAHYLCGMKSVSPELVEIRKNAFIEVLNALREGAVPRKVTHFFPKKRHFLEIQLLEATVGVLLIALIPYYAPVSVYTILIYVTVLAVLTVYYFISSYALLVVSNACTLFTKGGEVSVDTANFVNNLKRDVDKLRKKVPAINRLFSGHKLIFIYGLSHLYNQRLLMNTPISREYKSILILPPLFSPEEVELYVSEGEVTFSYSKLIDGNINYVFYHKDIFEVTLHCSNGNIFRLGVSIGWTIGPYLEIGKSVSLVRKIHGEEIDRVNLLLESGITGVKAPPIENSVTDLDKQRISILLDLLSNGPNPSREALVNAENIVADYSHNDALELFRNISNEKLLQKPAFCQALIIKIEGTY